MNKWDERFLGQAEIVASYSKDRSTKVGAVIVGPDRNVLSQGYNGFPRGVNDNIDVRHERPIKYKWTEHAERNALYNALRANVPVKGATMYLNWFPCSDCARGIIQSGIAEIVCGKRPDNSNPTFAEDFITSEAMLHEAGIAIRFPNG